MTSYGVGVLAGVGYSMIANLTGSGLIGGAISAGLISAFVRGQQGDNLSNILGFAAGRQGLPGFNLNGVLGNLGVGAAPGARARAPYQLI